jgi:hypothetical protein
LVGVAAPVGSAEGRENANLSPGAGTAVDRTDLAEGQFTEAALNEERSFTIKERVVVSAGVSGEAIFQNEANREAVAEIFRAFEAEAGAGLHAGIHAKGVGSISGTVQINVAVGQTFVNDTVELNISSESRTGKSAENGNCSKSLFHFDLFL